MGVLHCYLSGFFLCCRYFGSVEGSKFVEMASVDNVKRTWVNYGGTREWSDPTQGQVGEGWEGERDRRGGGGMYSNWLVDNIAAEHLNTRCK